ncbi:MAG: hypothetical protein JSS81_22985 [Acidobacteria bacterium]|nr:hypothetical protein [Acidobacteriota bacterium]
MRLKNANSASFSKILRDMKRVDAARAAFAGRDAGAPSVADSYVEFTLNKKPGGDLLPDVPLGCRQNRGLRNDADFALQTIPHSVLLG